MAKASKAELPRDTTGFIWKLLEVTDPTTTAKVQFIPRIPAEATNISWSFGDTKTSTELSPINEYNITTKDSFTVVLSFRVVTDSTITRVVRANSAFFVARQDSSLASYKKVLRSGFLYPDNDPTLLGNMRYEWSIDGIVLGDTVMFDNPTFGHYPNIYANFKVGGIYNVQLKVWNTATSANTIIYSRSINIQPVFGATKEKFPNIPNVFTPNGDSFHDFFEVPTSGTSRLKFMVYSRTGALLYLQETNIIKWNGTNQNGKDLPEGIYYYVIEDLDSKYENAKGFFYIFRGK